MFNRPILQLSLLTALMLSGCGSASDPLVPLAEAGVVTRSTEIVHTDITATLFWIGEAPDAGNGYIGNQTSFWDDNWIAHYGGVDDPDRTTLFPTAFRPGENPFYFALPFSDFDNAGKRRPEVKQLTWAHEKVWKAHESIVKNRWIRISDRNRTVYAQWEDAGPFLYNDSAYVFGNARPGNSRNHHAGLDLSPAVWIYLGYDTSQRDTEANVTWQFVDATAVPDGPWKEVVTTSQTDWQ